MNIRIERHHKKPMPTKPQTKSTQKPAWEVMDELVERLGGSRVVAEKLNISQSAVSRWRRDNGGGIGQRKIVLRWHALLTEHGLEDQNPYKP